MGSLHTTKRQLDVGGDVQGIQKDPGSGQEAGILDTWLIHVHKVLLPGFFRKKKNQKPEINRITHTKHTQRFTIFTF